MANTPTVNRRQLGALIRHFRTTATPSITQQELGLRVFPRLKSAATAQGKIANIEGGDRSLDHRDLDSILDHLRVTDPEVIEWAQRAHANTSQRGRWNGVRSFYSEEFRTYVDLEEDSERIRHVGVNLVPDLLNEESYLREMWGQHAKLKGDEWVDRAVDARVLRTHILDPSHGKRFEFLLCESAVRRRFGSAAALRRQIKHILELSKQDNIRVRLVPFNQSSLDAAMAVRNPFVTFLVPGENVVPALEFLHFAVHSGDNRFFYDRAKIDSFNKQFQNGWNATLAEDASRQFLSEIYREYR